MDKLRFGPAGCDGGEPPQVMTVDTVWTGNLKTPEIPEYLASHGLDAFEVQCGHGVQMGEKSAAVLRGNAERHGISLSVHAPYFISLTNPERLEGNTEYLRQTSRLAGWLGARRVVVHTGATAGVPRELAHEEAARTMKAVLETARAENWPDMLYCLETMGKINQLGTPEEVFSLCKADERLLPCIDFGHVYARSYGEADGEEAFRSVLDAMETALGVERAKDCHIHFSKIAYNKGGESKHLTFDAEGGPDWVPLAKLLKERGYRSTVICESRGTQTRDSRTMKHIYEGVPV